MTAASFNNYRLRLYDIGTLHEMGLPAPAVDDLMQIMEFQPNLSPGGRFRTLPSDLVFKNFRHAVELHIEHGKHIVDGFCRLAIRSKSLGIPISSLTNSEVVSHVGSKLQKIGVRQLGLSCRNTRATAYKAPIKGNKIDYFSKLRSNTALNELMAVYIGGVQLVVGALMARRVGELKDLPVSGCLDESEEWLVFDNRKSSRGLFGSRSKEARPIEHIAVKMIKNLIRMQKILKRIGYIKEMTYLFSSPSLRGDTVLSLPSMHAYNRNLDLFCDYFQTDLNSKGQRYYIRQHQLRRFFALLFFHSSSFGGLETLQWMLGHTDIKHVWNYITESIDGATLRGAKAQYIAECLHRGGTDIYDNLAKLLKQRYGTDNFALVDTDELEDHISELMNEGTLEVEPDFFHDERGEHLRVIVKVRSIT